MFPLTLFFDFISRKLVDLFKIKNDDGLLSSSRTNITSLIDIGEDEGSVKTSETQLIDNFLKLDKIPLSKILTPEPDLYMIEKDTPIAKVIEENMNYGFSRIPVYEGDSDNIIGIVHSKDLLNHTGENITQLLRDPFFVPVQKKALTLLREMQLMRLHIALVIDEYGRLKGIVTLDDILEEIFGEIEDEKEISEENISFQNNQIYLLGGTKIKEFNQTCLFAALRESGLESLSNNIIESQIPEDEGIETVGGYIFTRLGRLPKEGESIDCGKIELIVDKISNNRITKKYCYEERVNIMINFITLPLITLFLLTLQAIFAGSEIALLSCDKSKIRSKADSGSSAAKLVMKSINRIEEYVSTSLVGENLCIVINTVIVSIFIKRNYPDYDPHLISVIVLTPLIVIFGQVVPKSIFQKQSTYLVLKTIYFSIFFG